MDNDATLPQAEVWKPVVGYEGTYEVSSYGRIKAIRKTETGLRTWIVAPFPYSKYIGVRLGKKGPECVHRIVARAFLPLPSSEGKFQVNHKDGNKYNSNVSNLEWVTPSENQLHAIHVLGRKVLRGESCKNAKLTEADVRNIRSEARTGNPGIMKKLATQYGVVPSLISGIVSGNNWKHLL